MPGIFRLAYGKNVIDYVSEARSYGVNQVVVFPKVCGKPMLRTALVQEGYRMFRFSSLTS